jgi:hypothetical protein
MNSAKQAFLPMTLLIKKAACALIVLMVVQVGMDTTAFGKGLLNFNFYQSRR